MVVCIYLVVEWVTFSKESRDVLIKATKLTKKFGNFVAVDGIDFEVYRGDCVGFLGPNGAGKTTTVRMMYCFLPPTSGELTIACLSVHNKCREIKCIVGVAPQEDNLDLDFSVVKNLAVYARYFDISKDEALRRADEQLAFFQLQEKRDMPIMALSTGMKRRLIFARALLNKPQVLLLDEPTTGLDPQARHLVWDAVRQLKKLQVTIILTTHYMDEAEVLCDRIIIIDHGKIIEDGKPKELIKKHIGEDVLELDCDESLIPLLKQTFSDARIEKLGERMQVFTSKPHSVFEGFLQEHKIQNVTIRKANLEDVFLKLTGRDLRAND
ncbi:MAG: ATP-binding cassette domain-containing protein [Candidatus Bathyarchaeota archaeon]|nr:ATP-binding cassette domain-containing protein [Candidatus Termiticorpusculum sp.]